MRAVTAALVLASAGFLAGATPLAAQHATAFDVEDGGRAFQTSCANCHGPDGDQIAGIDLGRGRLRRAYTDEELAGIILKGIPGTPMPATRMSDEQAARVVAYLRSTAATARAGTVTGVAARGQSVFEGKGGCTACHRAGDVGSRVGPDLGQIGQVRRAAELEQSILDPNAEVQPTNRFYRVVTRAGATVTGRLLNHDTFTVQLLATDGRLRSFEKATLASQGFVDSPMPSFRDRLTAQELADVVSYLSSLRGVAP